MKTRTEQLEFIRMNVNALSYCAWEGFLDKGRGVVCVHVDEHNKSTQRVLVYFLSEGEVVLMAKGWRKNHETRMVPDYDPKTEAVVLFVRSKGKRINVDCYRFQPRPAPPMAVEP